MNGSGRCRNLAILAALFAATGCRLFEREQAAGPLSYREQVAAIRNLVPPGTPREAAVAKLMAAGIVGEYSSSSRSIYYCQMWKRKAGTTAEMNVALLFNERGEFYGVQPADANDLEHAAATRFGRPPGGPDAQSQRPDAPTGGKTGRNGVRSPLPFPPLTPDELNRSAGSTSGPQGDNPRLGRRSPFDSTERN